MSYADHRQQLAEANRADFWPIEWIDWMLETGGAQFWEAPNSAQVTQVIDYPGGAKVCRSIAACGDLNEQVELIAPQIEEWARNVGCTACLVEGRDGWRRALKGRGYEPYQSVIVKGL